MPNMIVRSLKKTITWAILLVAILITLYPIAWTMLTSVRTTVDVYSNPWGLPDGVHFENYATAVNMGGLGGALVNSIIVTAGTLAILAALAPPAAYVLAKPKTWTRVLFYVFMLGIFIDPAVIIIPLYSLLNALRISDTLIGLILVFSASSFPYAILIVRASFLAVPRSIENSAKVDGLSTFQIFWQISLPLVMPAVFAALMIEGIFAWNNFFFPLVILRTASNFPLPLGLTGFLTQYGVYLGPLSAGVVISSLPIMVLYVVFADLIRRGLAGGLGVKGIGRET
jgi:raffinose/stachyose/melibiose transport system permease protein